MPDLLSLLASGRSRRVRFRAMTEAYDLVDSWVERVDTQLIEQEEGLAIRDREPVGLYRLLDHDSMPVYHSPVIVETGLFRKPESRSRWVLTESLHIWLGYAEGTLHEIKARFAFDPQTLRGLSVILGTAVLALCIIGAIVMAAVAGGGTEEAAGGQETQTSAQEQDHGFIDGQPPDSGADAADQAGDPAPEADGEAGPGAGADGGGQ